MKNEFYYGLDKDDVYNMADCIADLDDLRNAREVEGVTVEFCRRVSKIKAEFADCEDSTWEGHKDFDEYLITIDFDGQCEEISVYVNPLEGMLEEIDED